jgi:UDP-glucose 4-epimerase
MKILVTGSSGMIGTRLCEKLLDKKYDVTGIDIRRNQFSEKVDKITKIIDLRDINRMLSDFPANPDIIIHLAANARVYELVKNPYLALDNIIMAFNILELCRLKNIKNIIFSSSREVYGDSSVLCNENSVDLEKCSNTYSASKISGEALFRSFYKSHNIDYLILRLSNVYGMYDLSNRVIPLFIKKSLNNEDMDIYGGKEKFLDFVYIDDVIDAFINSIDNFNNYKNETFNVATCEKISILNLAKKINELAKSSSKITLLPNRPGETLNYMPSNKKIMEIMSWKHKYNFNKGMAKTFEWYYNFYNKK